MKHPILSRGMTDLRLGDCLDVLRTMPDCSVDSVVTDPPYGLSFMGKKWDYDVPTVEVWRECLRVLKPGGHLLAFAGTRTQHRMACNIEDAGFEIRDMIAWMYGSGFPKSLDVSKAIDKAAGRIGHATESIKDALRDAHAKSGRTLAQLNDACGFEASGYMRASSTWASVLPPSNKWPILRDVLGLSSDMDTLFQEAEREVVGQKTSGIANKDEGPRHTIGASKSVEVNITNPATDAAKQWEGWGTALKPAMEPITVARKPLIGTVAENVLTHGTGAINVDGCRVDADATYLDGNANTEKKVQGSVYGWANCEKDVRRPPNPTGRFPANLIHDGSDEVVGLFPQAGYGDTGSAARFFYTAKAAKSERQGVTHPTVKPLDLMAYLCRLVTPPGGTVLDPFMGSGTTVKAAISEGFQAIGIERDPQYFAMAEHRLNGAQLGLGLDLPA